jgi:hypothetical protein
MAHRKPERNPLFAGRWFEDEVILLCLVPSAHRSATMWGRRDGSIRRRPCDPARSPRRLTAVGRDGAQAAMAGAYQTGAPNRQVYTTNEVPDKTELERFEKIYETLADLGAVEREAGKSWYKFEKEGRWMA